MIPPIVPVSYLPQPLTGAEAYQGLDTHPNNMPPKATNRPTPIAVAEDPGTPSGFIIPMDRKLNPFETIL
jgi:hypothetical protein